RARAAALDFVEVGLRVSGHLAEQARAQVGLGALEERVLPLRAVPAEQALLLRHGRLPGEPPRVDLAPQLAQAVRHQHRRQSRAAAPSFPTGSDDALVAQAPDVRRAEAER